MGLFKKKSDPISERARVLSGEIAALEAQIKRLSAEDKKPNAQEAPSSAPPAAPVPVQPAPQPPPAGPQPRLRSTAMPHHRQNTATPAPASAPREPVFEEVDQTRIQAPPANALREQTNQLDVRKYSLGASWQRLKNHFRGPPTSNPKLVSYLAAGSIQGLRPLRYERRVARNRFIVLFIVLVVVLWGLYALFGRHR